MKIIIVLIIAVFSSFVEAEKSNVFFLYAKYKEYELIKEPYIEKNNKGSVLVPATLSITFEIIDIVQGDEEFKEKQLTFPLEVNSVDQLSNSEGVVLVVESNEGNSYKLLDWNVIGRVFCINEKLIPKEDQGVYFNSPFKWEKSKRCRFF